MSSAIPSGFRLELCAGGPRILARVADVLVAEFPRAGDPRLDTLRPVYAELCLDTLAGGLSADPEEPDNAKAPLALLALTLAACDEADTAFAVLNVCDGLTPQARRALREAWVLVHEAIGAWRGPDSVHARAARENRAVLRGRVAADAVDRFAAAVAAGADPAAAREAAVAAAAGAEPEIPEGVETVWNLARECLSAWPALDTDEPVSGADLVEWFAGIRERFRRALELRPRR
jgi:hypothetical protein